VAIRYFYYDDRTKIIENISHKRKRGESTKPKLSIGRIIEWKDGLDPEENVFQEAYALNSFTGMNSSFVLEVTNALSMANTRIIELETKFKNVKDELT